MSKALIIVDVQNDFCEGGSLAVDGGAAVAAKIKEYVLAHKDDYELVVTTQDWHEDPGDHFADEPDFKDSWPHHCVAGTEGANFHPNLEIDVVNPDARFLKGRTEAAYSGFEGVMTFDGSNTGNQGVQDGSGLLTLHAYLKGQGVTDVDVCGIATDYCVKATVIDAVKHDYRTTVLMDLTAAVGGVEAKVATGREVGDLGADLAIVTDGP